MIIEQSDVELISIKTKSLEDLDSAINNDSQSKNSKNFKNFSNKTPDNDSQFSSEDNNDAADDDEHFESSVRFVIIDKSPNGACGFHLTRTKWDPYPWVSALDNFTPAEKCGLKAGDCVLEVNGCDVLGLRITEIAKLVKSSQHQVTLLLWSTNCGTECNDESLCAAPMPRSLQRLSLVVQTVLSIIECPVCLDTITPPAMQCQNGHLLCVTCRIRAEKCPVCRDRYYPRPALIAEQIQSAITSAFNLCRNEDKVRQKIFGRHNRQRQMVKTTLETIRKNQKQQLHGGEEENEIEVHKSLKTDSEIILQNTTTFRTTSSRQTTTIRATATTCNGICDRNVADILSKRKTTTTKNACNKFLTKLLNSKAYSMENLKNGHNIHNTTNNNTPIMSAISQPQLFAIPLQHQQQRQEFSDVEKAHLECGEIVAGGQTSLMDRKQQQHPHLNTNQFNDFSTTVKNNHLLTFKPNFNGIENDFNINSNPCCKQMLNNKHKYFPSPNDLTKTTQNVLCLLESPAILIMNGKRPCPVVCETSYQTILRAIKVKNNTLSSMCSSCQNVGNLTQQTSTNSLKSLCSSTTSLNSTPNSCLKLSLSSSQNCQSSLSLSSSSTTPC